MTIKREYVCKAIWDSTACCLVVIAKDEQDAWDRAWKRVSRTEGGDSCLKVVVIKSRQIGDR